MQLPSFFRPHDPARVPVGERVYAIGDVHGELTLLTELLHAIYADAKSHIPKALRVKFVFLGDLIDRGPRSAELIRGLASEKVEGLIVLRGNHEAALVDAYHGNERAAEFWMTFGGSATLRSFGVPPGIIDEGPTAAVIEAMRTTIEPTLISWIEALPTSWEMGDYYFVHAGIKPGVPLIAQEAVDQLWIREDFLKSRRRHGKIVVHGHSVESQEVQISRNRISLDTGGHEHGVLSAIGLQDDEQWIIQVRRFDERDPSDVASVTADHQPTFGDIRVLLAAILEQEHSSRATPAIEPVSLIAPDQANNLQGFAPGIVSVRRALAGVTAAAVLGASTLFLTLPEQKSTPPANETKTLASRAPTAVRPVHLHAGIPPVLVTPQVKPKGEFQRSIDPAPIGATTSTPFAAPAAKIVDPYAGRVAKPLKGEALVAALTADRIATQELNRKQLEIITGAAPR
ncbi:metallophosphoesterase [Novosphingobium sp. 9U]|uniref:metallophosphoesterase n=1 Tax=Novosphingobium sp. 9U TaxID=2653158 RepID=UPI0012F0CFEF|nr:metallophosphoesterase [Novosphingobium sp. 9U]VWX50759.1 putative Protein-serine/threonine phosphatase [Novosphingobium sp. 9U]